jgi:opacity protein-like surface antigen
MKHFLPFTFLTLLALAPAAFAQNWEVGVGGGTNFYTSQTVTNPVAGNAQAKLATGFLVSAWLGNNTSGMFGGELRYDYEHSDLKLSSDGTNVSFGGAQTNALHYDAVLRFASHEARVSPYVVGGVGIKNYSGTGKEQVAQPLSDIALLTKTSQFKPLISVGGGIKFQVASNVTFRVEAHDFLTPFPNQVIAPALGSKVGGWLSDFAVMAGLSFSF